MRPFSTALRAIILRMSVPSQFVFERMPETDDELWWFVYAIWGIKIPRQRVCPNHCSPFEAFADAFFARYPVTIWKASRGYGGKSYLLSLLGLTEAVVLAADTNILGGSGAQSINVHEHTVSLWAAPNAPKHLLKKEPTKFDTLLTNTAKIRSLMASQTSVRGPHPQRLRLDEIDEMEIEILRASQGQPMRKIKSGSMIETQTVMSSTHQYPDGTMSAMLEEAKENDWPVYEWCYRETSNPIDGWLQPDEIERKRKEITAKMWETEYDLQEPSFEGRSIDSDAVKRMFDIGLGVIVDDLGVLEHKRIGMRYVTAVDWARKRDHSVMATYRVSISDSGDITYLLVAWRREQRKPWHRMVNNAIRQWQEYGGVMIHDATGVGDVVDDIIKEKISKSDQRRVKGFVIPNGEKRTAMITEYIAAIEHDKIRSPMIDSAYHEHLYVTDDDLFKPSGHAPDTFMAGALGWLVRPKKKAHGVVAPISYTKTSDFLS